MKKWIKILAITLGSLIVVATGLIVYTYIGMKNTFNDPYSAFKAPEANLDPDKEGNQHEYTDAETGDKYVKTDKIVNILLLGIDSNAKREAKHKGYRSDMMMLCTIDFENNKMNLLSMPRDLWVDVYKMDVTTGEVTATTQNRINTAYSFGGGPNKFGAKNAMLCVERLLSMDGKFDIDIDLFFSLDIDALPKIADAVGGVEVELEKYCKGVGNKGDKVTITSANIDSYIRERKTSGGDYSRADRQQNYIMAVAKKIQSQGAVKMAPALYSAVSGYTKTNLTLDQCVAIAGFLDGFDMDELTRHTVEANGARKGTASVLEVDQTALSEYLLEYFYDQKSN